MCRLKKHAYAKLQPGENHASQAKSLRPNTSNPVFQRALLYFKSVEPNEMHYAAFHLGLLCLQCTRLGVSPNTKG